MIRSRPIISRCIRSYSTTPTSSSNSTAPPPSTRPPPKQREQVTQRQKIELAQQGLKDIFDGFLTTEETFEPIDTKPILANPKSYDTLTEFHRNQVFEEVDKKLRRNWNDVSQDVKRMAYYISYGNYGPRHDLKNNLFRDVVPEDLPFNTPSIAKIGKVGDKVKQLPPVDLEQINAQRKENWNRMTRRLDPFTKFIVYLAAFISLGALYRDKFVEDSKVEVPENSLVLADLQRELEAQAKKEEKELDEIKEQKKDGKKWYYLWLK